MPSSPNSRMGVSTLTSSLQALQLITTFTHTRASFGVNQLNYKQYRQFCIQRVKKLRNGTTAPNLKLEDDRNPDYNGLHFTTGLPSIRQLKLLIFTIERYWAFASDLLNTTKVVDPTSANKLRNHAVRKLKIAAKFCTALDDYIKAYDNASPALHITDVFEAKAYLNTIKTQFHVEKQDWYSALDTLKLAKSNYESVISHCVENDHTHVAICQSYIDSLNPYIRLCIYSLTKKGIDINNVAPDLLRDPTQSTSQLSTLSDSPISTSIELIGSEIYILFLDNKAIVEDSKLVPILTEFIHLSKSFNQMDKADGKLYLRSLCKLITLANKAEKLASSHIKNASLNVVGVAIDSVKSHSLTIANYIQYARSVLSTTRHLLTVDQLLRHADWILGSGIDIRSPLSVTAVDHNANRPKPNNRKRKAHPSQTHDRDTVPDPPANPATSFKLTKNQQATNKLGKVINLLDRVHTNLTLVTQLPKLQANSGAAFQVLQTVHAFQAYRLAILSHVYSLNQQWSHAVSAAQHGLDLIAAKNPAHAFQWTPDLPRVPEWVHEFLTAQAGPLTIANQVLSTKNASSPELLPITSAPFSLAYAKSPKLNVCFASPTTPLPVPAKPIFLDIAHDLIQWPKIPGGGLEEEENVKASFEVDGANVSAGSGTWFGKLWG